MNTPLNVFDCGKILDFLTGNKFLKLYYLDVNNKNIMFNMIKKKDKKSESKDFFMIFYDLAKIGHWACMTINYEQKLAYFYCSFGLFIDEQFKYKTSPKSKNKEDLIRRILRYLYKIGYEVHYNNKILQSESSSICGRYCVLFIAMNKNEEITPDDFNNFIIEECSYYKCTPDELILDITSE